MPYVQNFFDQNEEELSKEGKEQERSALWEAFEKVSDAFHDGIDDSEEPTVDYDKALETYLTDSETHGKVEAQLAQENLDKHAKHKGDMERVTKIAAHEQNRLSGDYKPLTFEDGLKFHGALKAGTKPEPGVIYCEFMKDQDDVKFTFLNRFGQVIEGTWEYYKGDEVEDEALDQACIAYVMEHDSEGEFKFEGNNADLREEFINTLEQADFGESGASWDVICPRVHRDTDLQELGRFAKSKDYTELSKLPLSQKFNEFNKLVNEATADWKENAKKWASRDKDAKELKTFNQTFLEAFTPELRAQFLNELIPVETYDIHGKSLPDQTRYVRLEDVPAELQKEIDTLKSASNKNVKGSETHAALKQLKAAKKVLEKNINFVKNPRKYHQAAFDFMLEYGFKGLGLLTLLGGLAGVAYALSTVSWPTVAVGSTVGLALTGVGIALAGIILVGAMAVWLSKQENRDYIANSKVGQFVSGMMHGLIDGMRWLGSTIYERVQHVCFHRGMYDNAYGQSNLFREPTEGKKETELRIDIHDKLEGALKDTISVLDTSQLVRQGILDDHLKEQLSLTARTLATNCGMADLAEVNTSGIGAVIEAMKQGNVARNEYLEDVKEGRVNDNDALETHKANIKGYQQDVQGFIGAIDQTMYKLERAMIDGHKHMNAETYTGLKQQYGILQENKNILTKQLLKPIKEDLHDIRMQQFTNSAGQKYQQVKDGAADAFTKLQEGGHAIINKLSDASSRTGASMTELYQKALGHSKSEASNVVLTVQDLSYILAVFDEMKLNDVKEGDAAYSLKALHDQLVDNAQQYYPEPDPGNSQELNEETTKLIEEAQKELEEHATKAIEKVEQQEEQHEEEKQEAPEAKGWSTTAKVAGGLGLASVVGAFAAICGPELASKGADMVAPYFDMALAAAIEAGEKSGYFM